MPAAPEITLYNTRTRRKERLAPVVPGKASMYVCGPTVYDRAHIGNARPVVVFDVLFRLLRHAYGAENVTYVRNITDVEDKINARAKESGRSIGEITAETTRWYHEDMDALGALRPTFEPRATEYIGEMIAMIAVLIERGHAYAPGDGHVLFDVRSYPDYGKLARRSLEDMRAGARVEVAPYKRDPMDFVLWKPSDAETPGWKSPWRRGRPGWHIECSAMARALLGAEFDIHGGGLDLAFPHHENELAQSVCAHPDEGFARMWMHNGMLNVEGEKMSKSLGNFFTVRDLLDKGIPGEVIRFVLLSTHYRQPMDWTKAKADEAERTLRRWEKLLDERPGAKSAGATAHHGPSADFVEALADDLNTSRAISVLHELFDEAKGSGSAANRALTQLHVSASLFGLHLNLAKLDEIGWSLADAADAIELIQRLVDARAEAKLFRDFQRADEIRKMLAQAGVDLMDGPDGTSWERKRFFSRDKLRDLT